MLPYSYNSKSPRLLTTSLPQSKIYSMSSSALISSGVFNSYSSFSFRFLSFLSDPPLGASSFWITFVTSVCPISVCDRVFLGSSRALVSDSYSETSYRAIFSSFVYSSVWSIGFTWVSFGTLPGFSFDAIIDSLGLLKNKIKSKFKPNF